MGCGVSASREPSQPSNAVAQAARLQNANDILVRPGSKALIKPKPYQHDKDITKEQLVSLREEFWNTRVEGNKLMWQALRSCCEAMLSNDIELANAILQASNMSTSTGYVDECYDELGRLYNVPKYCYCEPIEVTSFYKTCVLAESTKSEAPASLAPKDIPIIPPEKNDLKIRIRVNPGEINITLDCYSGQSVLDLKRMITKLLHQRAQEQPNGQSIQDADETQQRVMFMGKELQNGQLLKSTGIDEVRVVQVFLKPKKKV